MEWKKEKISEAELERRQKEYMNAAMSMVRRSHIQTQPAVREPEPAAPEPVPAESVTEEPAAEETADTEPTAGDETPADSDDTPEQTEPQSNENYGVYTADELLNGKSDGEGLKKAAEILEEMTRNTEIMRKLANENSDSGTTDFPDFSCDADSGDKSRFREDSGENGNEAANNGKPAEEDE